MSKIILIRGIPGSGKSTAARTLFPNTFRVENDMYFMRDGEYCYDKNKISLAVMWCGEMVKNAVELGIDVVVANTFTRVKYIEFYKNLAKEYGADFEVYRCVGDYGSVHSVPNYVMDSFRRSMEPYPGEQLVENLLEIT